MEAFSAYYLPVLRYIAPLLAAAIFICARYGLLKRPKKEDVLAVLDIQNGSVRLPITRHENTIGRSKSCDIVISLPVISRQHAVLSRTNDGFWQIADTKSKGGVLVNNKPAGADTKISLGDKITLSELEMKLLPPNVGDMEPAKRFKDKKSNAKKHHPETLSADSQPPRTEVFTAALVVLGIFQILTCLQMFTVINPDYYQNLFISFGVIIILPWVYRIFTLIRNIHNISAEITAFFLSTIGICTTASAAPGDLLKQTAAMVAGVVLFVVIMTVLKNLKFVMKLRMLAAIGSLGLLGLTMVLGTAFNGQRNWIDFGFITIQPSEFVKILFVFSGSATLEWLLTTKNLALLTIYSSACIGLLFLMGDFGTALIFFVAFLVLIFMTSGDIRMIILSCLAAVMGAVMIISYKPYILGRFSTWMNVWSDAYGAGYQQTRTLMAIASGGMLGLGGGNGFLRFVTASDTDMVFGIVCEEWGLLIGLIVIGCFVVFMRSAIRSHRSAYSSFYVIAACTAGSIFLFQATLNIFGSTDILPFTGVTLPFISNGGTSIMASWGLLSFISASTNYLRPR